MAPYNLISIWDMRRYLPMSELLIPYSLIFIWDMSRYLAISQLLTSQ